MNHDMLCIKRNNSNFVKRWHKFENLYKIRSKEKSNESSSDHDLPEKYINVAIFQRIITIFPKLKFTKLLQIFTLEKITLEIDAEAPKMILTNN